MAIVILIMSMTSIYAQSSKKYMKKARSSSNKKEYYLAKEYYLKSLAKDSSSFYTNYELGLILHNQLNDIGNAGKYYLCAENLCKNDTIPDLVYGLAQYYHYSEDYPKAILYYRRSLIYVEEILEEADLSYLIRKEIDDCIYSQKNINENLRKKHIAKNIGNTVNTEYPEYVPVINLADSNQLFFTARRNYNTVKRKDKYDAKFFEGMFIANKNNKNEFRTITPFLDTMALLYNIKNKKSHESVIGFSKDGKKIIIYKDNNLYLSNIDSAKFSEPILFDKTINIGDYNNHASFSTDENTIYFSAIKEEGGFGDLDIYKSEKLKNGNWSEAINLGNKINTAYSDQCPEISDDGKTLYFSSNGHLGYGGFDVYKTILKDSIWQSPINMSMPINSAGDDIHIKFNATETQAYFASSRKGGFGDMDIYLLTPNNKKFDNCLTYPNKTYPIKIDASKSIDTVGQPFKIKWVFDDGYTDTGFVVKHVFEHPGKHIIKLNAIDNKTGRIEFDDAEETVMIDSVNHIGFRSPDSVVINTTIAFDATCSYLKNEHLANYFWKINDSILDDDTPILNYSFAKIGNNIIALEVLTQEGVSYCYENNCYVMPSKNSSLNTDSVKDESGTDTITKTIAANNINTSAYNTNNNDSLQTNDDTDKQNADNVFELKYIYFDFNKHSIRADAQQQLNKNLAVLNSNRNLQIYISAHCDSRGSKKYNKKLSAQRAKETVSYLIKKGLDKSRIVSTLKLGETQLVNNCEDNVPCTENAHQQNRRVEFKLVIKP